MACLDDGLLLSLLGLLPGRNLARAAAASKSLYCFANHEPLWKALAVEVGGSSNTAFEGQSSAGQTWEACHDDPSGAALCMCNASQGAAADTCASQPSQNS